MVETITPVVHGGHPGRWGVALALHAAGAAISAAAFGAVLALTGAALGAPWGRAGLALVGGLAALYLTAEVLGVRVPVPQMRRQVPDWWRTFFPLAPAAFLYGVGLGVGFFTYLRHGTLVVVSAAAVASGRPAAGAVLVGAFGLARGLSVGVAFRTRSSEEGALLVGSLARSASWSGWRVAHAVVLGSVLVAAMIGFSRTFAPGEPGELAAAVLAFAFGAAGMGKLVRGRAWRRALGSYGLPAPVERSAALSVPVLELCLAALAFLGLTSTAGLASLAVLGVFSAAIVVARIRGGRRFACGCFGSGLERDYRFLISRNAALALAGLVAWTQGQDAPVVGGLGVPDAGDLVPAILAGVGLVIAGWVSMGAVTALRRAGVR
jgi:hypothetical protein